MNILDELVEFIGHTLRHTPGEDIFYNEMPDMPAKCILVTSPKHSIYVPAQIDATAHEIRVTTRDTSSSKAYDLAAQCYQTLYSDTSIVETDKLSLSVNLHGTPIWEKTDQQSRRYYYFTATIITKRII